MKILLDTHAFIWFDSGDSKLSSKANQLILDPNNIVLLSVASIWEMMIKVMAGKLTLREKVETTVKNQQTQNNIELLAIVPNHTWTLASLPPIHKDPFDRILVAQALVEQATLLTTDPLIRQYPVQTEW